MSATLTDLPAEPGSLPERGVTFLSLLERQMRLHSTRPAIISAAGALTYRELDKLSATCAGAIAGETGNRSGPVALLMCHGPELITAMVGVVRSGCFYIVLNPLDPAARLIEVLKKVRPKVTIADARNLEAARGLGAAAGKVVTADEIAREAAFSRGEEPDARAPLAVFHTSGSSGQAKALVWTHGGTLHYLGEHARALEMTPRDRVSMLSPCWAAASASVVFGPLLNGACVCPFDPSRAGFNAMHRWIEETQITVYQSVPSLFRRFSESLPPGARMESVRAIKFAGEPLFAGDIERCRNHFSPSTILVNSLGITEANGNVCHFRIEPGMRITTATVPVGKALDGMEITLLDGDGNEVAPGETGEITIRGDYLSPGSWNGEAIEPQPTLTDGWLRTGDLARRDAAGTYEHLGRKDGQFKLRGLWVNPSEVEAELLRVTDVTEAAAIVVESAGQEHKLVAFLVWRGPALPQAEVRSRLAQGLPPHLIPSHYLTLAEFPRLPNGKVDRLQLGKEAVETLGKGRERSDAPDDPLELQLIQIWEKALQVEGIRRSDDFFDLGGDSLAAAAMFAEVEKWFGVDLPASTLLRAGAIETLAALIRAGGWSAEDPSLWAFQLRGSRPALFCAPGAGMEAVAFRTLARRLGRQQPVCVFQPQGLNPRQPCHRTVEEMASQYLDILRRHQPEGPYCLCGASFGGVVVFEMARRLVAAGQRVLFVGLLDTYGGDYPRVIRPLSPARVLRLAVHRLIPLKEGERLTWAHYMGAVRAAIRDFPDALRVKLHLRFPRLPTPYRLRHACMRAACVIARRGYRFPMFPGKLHLFRVEERLPSDLFETDPLLGWQEMAALGIEVHDVPGRHGHHLQGPDVGALAEKITEALDVACAGEGLIPSLLSNR